MGLDAVEIVMEIEDTFHISLEDGELQNTVTVQALSDLVQSKVHASDNSTCLNMVAFNIIRKAMIQVLKIERNNVHTWTKLSDLVDRGNAKDFWQKLSHSASLKFSHLTFSKFQVCVVFSLITLFFIVSISYAFLNSYEPFVIALGFSIFTTSVFSIILSLCYWPFVKTIPRNIITMGDLVHDIVRINYYNLSKLTRTVNKQDVQQIVRSIIANQLNINIEKVKPESKFIGELIP